MTTAESFANTSDSFGKGFPLIEEIINEGGVMINNSAWHYNVWPPFKVWEFPDKSQLIWAGYPAKLSAR
jgi:hypothetical protein